MKLILGGPGCGKTTRLLGIMEEELARGVPPDRLAFVSFTRRAVLEATERACAKFNLQPAQLPYFRTIHSMAYRLMGISQSEILRQSDWDKLAVALGYQFSRYANIDDGMAPTGRERGDLLRFMDQLARARCVTPDQQLRDSREEVTPQEFKRYRDTLLEYKKGTGRMDFTDLLERYVAEGMACPAQVAIIDEAQDLSQLQWRMVHRAFTKAERMYIGGDDDQAIFRWSGADVATFLSLDGEREVLGTTYRLPRRVYDYSRGIVSRLSRRYSKQATPRDHDGVVTRIAAFEHAPVEDEGTWMFLARNSFYLTPVKQWLHGLGLPYALHNGSSINATYMRAVYSWERLRKGEALGAEEVRQVYKLMEVKRGHKTLPGVEDTALLMLDELCQSHGCLTRAPWFEAFTKIPLRERTYYRAALRRGEALNKPPRIYVGTVHSVKGGEADNVVVLPNMTQRTWDDFERVPDDEHRTFYVAATRAKTRLFLASPTSPRSYSL